MDKVLIVDDNKYILNLLRPYQSQYQNEFEMIFADSGKKAMAVLARMHIDLVVTDLVMPHIDGLTLLAHINEHHPSTLCIAMTAYASENVIKMMPDNLLQLVRKPFKVYELMSAVKKSLKIKPLAGTIEGISIASFLQLIVMDQKSCKLEILLPGNKKGAFLFKEGLLYDAAFESLTGKEAAIELIKINDKASFTLLPLPHPDIPRKLNSRITELLLEAARRRDMSASSAEKAP